MTAGPAGPQIEYGPDQRPPLGLAAMVTLQIVVVVALPLVYPVVVFRSAGIPLGDIPPVLSWGLFVLAGAALLQAARRPVGTGYLLPSLSSAIYLQPSIAAVGIGGRSVLAAMTVCAGAFESVFGYLVARFRRLFPPVVTGVIVMVVGMEIGLVAVTLGVDAVNRSLASPLVEVGVSVCAFMVIVAGVLWGNLWVRNFAPILGVVVGASLSALLITRPAADSDFLERTELFGLPGLPPLAFDFDARLVVPFMVLGLAAALRTVGVIVTLHDAAHPEDRHTDYGEVTRGVRNDGLGSVAAGLVGFPGVSSAPSAIGVSLASGIMSRVVSLGLAAVLVLLAFCPRLLAYLVTAPAAVVSALLLYYASFMIVGGVRLITRQPLDLRSTFVVGASVSLALGARVYGISAGAATVGATPDSLELVTGSMMTVGVISALGLSLLFRIGQRRRGEVVIEMEHSGVTTTVREDMSTTLAELGAPKPVTEEVVPLVAESIEAIHRGGLADGDIAARVSTDDLRLEVQLDYEGRPLQVDARRELDGDASTDENVFALGLSRYLDIARPDDVEVRVRGERVTLAFAYDLV